MSRTISVVRRRSRGLTCGAVSAGVGEAVTLWPAGPVAQATSKAAPSAPVKNLFMWNTPLRLSDNDISLWEIA